MFLLVYSLTSPCQPSMDAALLSRLELLAAGKRLSLASLPMSVPRSIPRSSGRHFCTQSKYTCREVKLMVRGDSRRSCSVHALLCKGDSDCSTWYAGPRGCTYTKPSTCSSGVQ